MNDQILILSFWNPTKKYPQQGIFIQDQAAAVCSMIENIIFLKINLLTSRSLFLRKDISETSFFKNRQITINFYSALWKFYYHIPWIMAIIIRRILKKHFPEIKPVLIHSNVIFPCGIVAYLLSLKTGSKLIISEHWTKVEQFLKRPLYKSIALKTYKANKAIICVSNYLVEKIKKNVPHDNVMLIPNIVNEDVFKYNPKKTFDGKNLTFICVAMWKPPKRLDLIFDALSHLATESKLNITLNLVGAGIQVDALSLSSIPENLTIIKHGSYLDKQVIASLLQSSDFFLHASDIETFSIVTAEALITGTPALVSNIGALDELVRTGNGLLADNNSESWKKSIMTLIATNYNHETIALENHKRFSPKNVGAAIIEVYKKTLNYI